MKILILNSYDSFVYNIVHAVRSLGQSNLDVVLCDKMDLDHVTRYDKIILSPGPGIPSEAGVLLPLIERYAPTKSILGVCLGHQAIGESFGAQLVNLASVYHGVALPMNIIEDEPMFRGLPRTVEVGRYHSWVVGTENFPGNELLITATDNLGNIMAAAHRRYDVRGVQFHPESILTPQGMTMISNWLKM